MDEIGYNTQTKQRMMKIGGVCMIKTRFVLAVSLVAFMAVGVAHADIAATSYFKAGSNISINDGTISATVPTGSLASKDTISNADVATNAAIAQSKIANLTTDLAGKASTTSVTDITKTGGTIDTKVTTAIGGLDGKTGSVAVDGSYVVQASQTDGIVTTSRKAFDAVVGTATKDSVNAPQTKAVKAYVDFKAQALDALIVDLADTKLENELGDEAANKAVITDANGSITAGTIATGMITDGTIVNADISTSAKIAQSKIENLTTDLAGKLANTSTITNAIVTTDANGAVAPVVIEDNGSGTFVKDVTVSAGKVTLTRGSPNNATLTIKNGATSSNIGTFTANASAAKTITIPAATATVAGLAKIGVIPSGSDKSGTAEIWVQ